MSYSHYDYYHYCGLFILLLLVSLLCSLSLLFYYNHYYYFQHHRSYNINIIIIDFNRNQVQPNFENEIFCEIKINKHILNIEFDHYTR